MKIRKAHKPGRLGRQYKKIVYPLIILLVMAAMTVGLVAPAFAAGITYSPNSDLDLHLNPTTGATHYSKVSDSDPNTTVFTNSENWQYDRYGLPNHDSALNSTTISSVIVYARVSAESYQYSGSERESARTYLRINNTDHYGSGQTIAPGAWHDISTRYDHVPGTTSTAWTWADIDNLQVGVSLRAPGADRWSPIPWGYYQWVNSWCTSVWVDVIYSYSTTTTLVSNNNPSNFGDSVTFTATVTRAGGTGTPSGTVIFKDGLTTLGTGTLTGSGSSATATYTTSSLSLGSHSITAVYGGDSVFAGSISAPLAQEVPYNTVTTNDATDPTLYGATLHGTLDNYSDAFPYNATAKQVYFQWSPTTSYLYTTYPPTNMSAGGPFSFVLSDAFLVTSGNTYHYRAAVLINLSGGGTVTHYGEDKTFTAASGTVTVTFNGNGGNTPSPTSKVVTVGSTYGTLATVSRTGYTFAGWYTDASAGSLVTASTTVTIGTNHTLYAHWTPNQYTVTFNGNGGNTPSPTSKSVTYGSTYGTLATVSRTGYTFAGWFTDASAGSEVTAATAVTITGPQTLYAHWAANNYTVTFNSNGGGTPSPTSKSVTYGSTYGTLATVTRTSYTFNGWYTAASGGSEVTASTPVTIIAPQTLYAHWVETVSTNDATSITGTGATLNSSLYNPEGLRYTCYFEYGTTTSYGSSTYTTPGYTERYDSGDFSAAISGLTAGQTYHFRAVALVWPGGSAIYGADKTFTTTVNNVTTNDSTSPTLYGATLHGTLSDYSAPGSPSYWGTFHAYFEFGATTSYGANSATNYTPMTGNGSFSYVLSDAGVFTPGNTYHYRAVVEMNYGMGIVKHYGEDKTFTTSTSTSTTISASNASGTYGGTVNISATLTTTSGSTPISGKTINFTINGSPAGSGVTNGSGVATSYGVSLSGINAGTYSAYVGASFAGDTTYDSSSDSAALTVTKATATVVLSDMTKTYTGSPQYPTATTTPPGLPIIWTGAPQTNAGSYPVTATVNDTNYQGSASGTFVIQMVYTLTVNQPATGGFINIDPNQTTFVSGSTVQLSIWTDYGYDFTGWTGDAAASGTTSPITITMNSNKTVSANIVPHDYFVNLYTDPVAPDCSASFVGSWGPFHVGDTVTVSASGGSAYHFSYWSGNPYGLDPGLTDDNPLTFTMPPMDFDLTAHFELNTYTLTVNYNTSMGSVTGGGIYPHGQEVYLNANPNPGYHFAGWSGGASGTSLGTSVIMDSNKTVTADFAIDIYQLHTSINGSGTVYQNGNPSSPQTYPFNTVVNLSAEPAPGWSFDHWSVGVANTSSTNTTITMDTLGDRYVTAYFINNPPVAEAGGPYSGNEGSPVTVDASGSTDAGGSITTYEWDWDNNGTFDTSGSSHIASHTWLDNGSYTIGLRVTDSAGATATDKATITVNNVAPSATFNKPSSVNEGSLVTISLTAPSDPSSVDTAAGFQYAFDFGGGYSPFGSSTSAQATAFDGPATLTVKGKIKDKDGGVREYTGTVTVNNVAPTIALSGDSSVNEGALYTLNLGAVTDPGTDTLTDYTINWGDDSSETFSAPVAASKSHTYTDGPTSHTITVSLKDEDGTFTGAGSKSVTVNNVAPVVSLTGNAATDEGASYSLTLENLVDPGSDTVSAYSVNWGDGTTQNFTGSPNGLTKNHTYADGPLSPTITVSLADEDGTFTGGTKGITVNNVAPTAASDNSEVMVNEGTTANNTGTFSDPGTDNVTVNASIGTVNKTGSNNGTWSWSYAATDGPNQSQTVTITVNDGEGGINTTTFHLTVNNVAPVMTAAADQTADEGTSKSFTLGSFTDPGADNPWAVDVDWGDGSTHTSFNLAATGTITAQSHAFPDNGIYTVAVKVTDKDGAYHSDTFSVTVSNVAPTVTASSNQTADEGTSKSFSLGLFSDPGALDNPWAVEVDWGDGSAHSTLNMATVGAVTNQPHTYADNGTFTVTVRVTDKDGASDSKIFDIVVDNVVPDVNAGADATVAWGNTFTQSGSFTDPGADTWEATVDYGDGTGVQGLTLTDKNFTLSHVYASSQIDIHTVTVTITDDDGGVDTDTLVVTVTKRNTSLVYSGDTSVEYSDPASVKATLTDNGGGTLQGTNLENKTITFTIDAQNTSDATDVNGLAQATITLNQIPGSYTVVSTFPGDDLYNASNDIDPFSVTKEKAFITFDPDNPVSKQVVNPGDAGVTLDLEEFIVYITQEADSNPGTQNLTGTVTAKLVPVGGGGAIDLVQVGSPDLSAFPGGGKAVYTFNCPANIVVPIETYTLEVTLVDSYYKAAQGEDVFVVYDPSLGFTTGGGWFYWPNDGSGLAGVKTNFGFTMKYNKKATSVQGSLLLIAHLPDGSIYRIKSNALDGLSIVSTSTPGKATFSGKCTYIGPDCPDLDLDGYPDNVGGQQFTVYVEDWNEPGNGVDKIWFNVLSRVFTLDTGNNQADSDELQQIMGGNIVVPHTPKSEGDSEETSGTPPTLASVSPNSGNLGQTLTVVITGANFTGATEVSFGAKITVVSFNVDNDNQITAQITIASNAKPGTRNVSVTTSSGTGTLTEGFTVN